MKLLVKYKFGKLIPYFNSDLENLKDCKLKNDEVYEVEIKKKRNYEYHKKYFALINLCFENQETFDTLEDLRFYLTMKSGFVKKVETGSGIMYIPKSISFASMDEIEFNQLYKSTLDVICKFLNTNEEDLINEIINFM